MMLGTFDLCNCFFFFVTVSPTLFDGDDTCFILYFVEVLSDPIP